jgi:hypothetical protein
LTDGSENKYGFRKALDSSSMSCEVLEYSFEAFQKLRMHYSVVRSDVFNCRHVEVDNRQYIVLENPHTLTELLGTNVFDDDMANSDARMEIALNLLRVADRLEKASLEFDWSIDYIYHTSGAFQLNPLGFVACKGIYTAMDNRKLLIQVLRYVLTGSYTGECPKDQEYVFRKMTIKELPLGEFVLDLASHVFNHSKIIDFFNGIANYMMLPRLADSQLRGVAKQKDIDKLVKDLNYKMLVGSKRVTDNWLAPRDGRERCNDLAHAIGFEIRGKNGRSMLHFAKFMRDIAEHWRDDKFKRDDISRFFALEGVKLQLENARGQKPTFIYRFVRDGFPLIFVKFYQIAKKHLSNYSELDLLFSDCTSLLEQKFGKDFLASYVLPLREDE